MVHLPTKTIDNRVFNQLTISAYNYTTFMAVHSSLDSRLVVS